MKRHFRLGLALLVALAFTAAACGGDDDTVTGATTTAGEGEPSGDRPTITIAAQDFGESAILAQIYKQAFEDAGIDVKIQEVGGFRDVELAAFESDTVNFAPEYAASLLEFLNNFAGEATSDVDETVAALEPYLTEKGLTVFTASDAVDTNAFVVTQDTADELGVASLSDLAANGDGLVLGAPQDCETNAFCLPGLDSVYGLDLTADFQPLEASVIFDTLLSGDIDVALLFSTDGRIAAEGLVLLDDDLHMLAADNVLPLLTQEVADAYGAELTDITDAISAALTTDALIEMNKRYDIDREDAEVIATDWLTDNGLIG